jgi:hypothetical protein
MLEAQHTGAAALIAQFAEEAASFPHEAGTLYVAESRRDSATQSVSTSCGNEAFFFQNFSEGFSAYFSTGVGLSPLCYYIRLSQYFGFQVLLERFSQHGFAVRIAGWRIGRVGACVRCECNDDHCLLPGHICVAVAKALVRLCHCRLPTKQWGCHSRGRYLWPWRLETTQ